MDIWLPGLPLVENWYAFHQANGSWRIIYPYLLYGNDLTLSCAIMQISVICDWNFQIMIISLIFNYFFSVNSSSSLATHIKKDL